MTYLQIEQGDCVELMAAMPDACVDAIVTDPPYGLEFMGKDWDRIGDVRQPGDPTFTDVDNPYGRSKVRMGGSAVYRAPETANRMQAWHEAWTREAFRVLKPGGHLLAFGGTRTYHRLACAVEDAGFEIRDSIMWIYGSGFPKSMNVSKAIDKAARGVPQGGTDPSSPNHGQYKTQVTEGKRGEGDHGQGFGAGPGQFMLKPGDVDPATGRVVLSVGTPLKRMIPGADQNATGSWDKDNGREFIPIETAPATAAAQEWDGWGTALKPAHEPIVVARKPLIGTVIKNVQTHGTGALNIDASRVTWGEEGDKSAARKAQGYSEAAKKALGSVPASESTTMFTGEVIGTDATAGRWPANIILTHSIGCVEAGTRRVPSGTAQEPDGKQMSRHIYGATGTLGRDVTYADADGQETMEASHCVDGCPVAELNRQSGTSKSSGGQAGPLGRSDIYGAWAGESEKRDPGYGDVGGASRFFYCAKANKKERNAGLTGRNAHPTVKPIALMRYLVRMVTPPGGLVLDPFLGSGTTGCAAVQEDFDFIGLELNPEYVAIAEARIAEARGDNPA